MSKKLTKPEQDAFKKEVEKILADANFTLVYESSIGGSNWELDSNVGNLYVSLHGYSRGKKLYSIYTRFDNPALAKERWCFLCNPYSGKFNFHCNEGDDGEGKSAILSNFNHFINLVTKGI